MRDISHLTDDLLTDVSIHEKKLLDDFLRVSTHPVSAPSKIEAHILTSLALALRTNQTAV